MYFISLFSPDILQEILQEILRMTYIGVIRTPNAEVKKCSAYIIRIFSLLLHTTVVVLYVCFSKTSFNHNCLDLSLRKS